MINSLEVLADIAIETFKKLTPEQRQEWIKKNWKMIDFDRNHAQKRF